MFTSQSESLFSRCSVQFLALYLPPTCQSPSPLSVQCVRAITLCLSLFLYLSNCLHSSYSQHQTFWSTSKSKVRETKVVTSRTKTNISREKTLTCHSWVLTRDILCARETAFIPYRDSSSRWFFAYSIMPRPLNPQGFFFTTQVVSASLRGWEILPLCPSYM